MKASHARRYRAGLLIGLWLTWAGVGADAVDPAVEKLFADALTWQEKATSAKTPTEALDDLAQAITLFTEVTQRKPTYCEAYQRWSLALLQRAKLSSDPAMRQTQIKLACDRFTATAQCADTDWQAYFSWAKTLRSWIADKAISADERRLALEQASQACTVGLTRARFDNQRARLETERAICLTGLAELAAEPAEKRRLYEQARNSFQFTERSRTEAGNFTALKVYGMALLQLGKLSNDPAMLRQAVVKLQAATELAPSKSDPFYNLACAYALLGQADDSLQSLRLCLDNDPRDTFAKMARDDDDLKSLRNRADFQQLMQPKQSASDIDKFYFTGLELQDAAERSPFAGSALDGFQKACEQFEKATQANPDYSKAHLQWARCLVSLAERAPDPSARRKLMTTAQQRYETAARCPNSTATMHHAWGTLLVHSISRLATENTDRREILTHARSALERGLDQSQFSRDRAMNELVLGTALGMLASLADNLDQQRRLYAESLTHFDAALKTDPSCVSAGTHKAWGTILMEFSKLKNDRATARKAIDHFNVAVNSDPSDYESRYNLACLYARINQTDFALRHLRLCLENDPQNFFHITAVKDPDLKSLRQSVELRELFPEESTTPLNKISEPAPKQ